MKSFYKFCPKCGSRLIIRKIGHKKRLICDHCGFISYQNPKPGVDAIIIKHPNRILLVKRKNAPYKNYWDLPGGFIEENEDPLAALKRELLEELNLKINKTRLFDVHSGFYPSKENICYLLGVIYIVEDRGLNLSDIKINDDVVDFRFFNLNRLPNKIAFPSIVKKALENYKCHLKDQK